MPAGPATSQALTSAGAGSGTPMPGHTHFVIDAADIDAIREIRAAAAARVAEMRDELAVLEAELAVLDEALEENAEAAGDG
jgi:hypothetical protein